ncbi:unnamed protein product [Adineta steineri]|uniref:Uncharacterized protein n=1 Tax=Adineta steineri TaxID=433720 RepID=A0A814CTT2_9BILA|nr:unnamed protein product [Adineta steineri]
MKLSPSLPIEKENTSLDPTDWASARCMAHQMLDSSLDYIQYVRDRPVWRAVPYDVRAVIEDEPIPKQGQPLATVCHDVINYVMPYARGNAHPRFWGWVSGEGTLGGIIGDMVSATLNVNACASTHSAAFVERTIIDWMRNLFNFPEESTGGLLVSGTSIATVISIATARRRVLVNVREDGLVNGQQLVAYVSTESHGCVVKAMELLGLGSKAVHLVPVDENFSIKIAELKTAIKEDRDKGLIPFCIVGNAGTVNTGAFDDLLELSKIARAENLWFHVDGAFGSFVILDPQRSHLVTGIDQADSLAFDFHKWLHCPYDVGCVLVRDSSLLHSTFSTNQGCLERTERGCSLDDRWFYHLGPELSRSFRALKVWFTLKEHGTVKLGQKIAENCEQAQYLVSLLEKYTNIIRIVYPVSLNIVNFRFEPEEFDKDDHELLESFNDELVVDIQMSGIALPSSSRIQNRRHIRIAVVSHRSTHEDFDIFMETLMKLYRSRVDAVVMARNGYD